MNLELHKQDIENTLDHAENMWTVVQISLEHSNTRPSKYMHS
jgi:hypothetical protein